VNSEPKVFIVAGDSTARRELTAWVESLDLPAEACRSADEFLAVYRPRSAGCILLSVGVPSVDLELLRRLGPGDSHLPVIAVAKGVDVSTVVQAMKLGVRDFVERSTGDERLAEAVHEALAWDAQNRRRIARAEGVRRRLAQLNHGQHQVLDLLMTGRSNPQIAQELGLSTRSIEVRRGKIMRTMGARSVIELVRRVLSVGPPQ
jgi:FixJ family two-component response regulator